MIVGLFQTTILSIILFPFIQCMNRHSVILSKWSLLLIFLNNVTWHLGYHFHLQENGDFSVEIIILSLISGYLFEYVRSEIHLQVRKLKKANEKIKKLDWELSNWRLIYKKDNDNYLREIINTIDDIKDKIPDGVYLKLMNYSKKIYENKKNTCEGWWTESFELLNNH